MQLSQQAIQDFKRIYREDYSIILSDEEAVALAASFFNLMRIICRPLPDENCRDDDDVLY